MMKKLEMFVLAGCPYCREALRWMDELAEEKPEYRALEIEIIDEKKEAERAEAHDYWYVPSYYLGGEKLHEGAATKEKIERVLLAAIESDSE